MWTQYLQCVYIWTQARLSLHSIPFSEKGVANLAWVAEPIDALEYLESSITHEHQRAEVTVVVLQGLRNKDDLNIQRGYELPILP